jgi:tetratricopeptide (TPR) repeat protein
VVRHEYVHTVTLSQTRNRIPHWMTEAIAVDLQHKRRDYKECQMLAAALEGGTLFDFDSILLAFVRPVKPTDRAQAYAQGHWWVEFIRATWGDDALRRMLALYAEGATESQALAQVLDVSKEQFLERFTPWARTQVKAWGLAPEPPPDALLGKDRVEPVSDKELDLLLRSHPEHPDLLELAVRRRTERGEGDAPEVIELLERLCRARPVDPFPHRKLAEVALLSGRDGEAVPHLERLDAVTDRENSYAIELSRIARAAGDGARAGNHIERAVRINPFDPSLRELAAATQIEAGNLAAARVHVVALGILEPDREQHKRRLVRLDELIAKAP